MTNIETPELRWEAATGYDFFVSLHVLHAPDQFALRASWAKGVRTRLPTEARAFFEETSQHLLAALLWVHRLPQPRNASTILKTLSTLPPEKRFSTLLYTPGIPEEVNVVLERIAARRWRNGTTCRPSVIAGSCVGPCVSNGASGEHQGKITFSKCLFSLPNAAGNADFEGYLV